MPIKTEREYRLSSPFEVIEDTESGYIVEGYATTFDVPYDFGYDGVKEMIKSSALIGADMSDVIFQMNHDGQVLARQRNNSLQVTCDEHGLHVRADLGGSEAGRSLHEAIKNGLMDKMSWGFLVADDGWEFDRENRVAIVTKITKVFDVSAVSLPANEDTEISARSYLDGVIKAEQQELLLRAKEMEERQRLSLLLQITTERY